MRAGVIYGNELAHLYQVAREKSFGIPSVNVTNSNTINAALEAAKQANSPIILQISNRAAHYFVGESLSNENEKAAVAGSKLFAEIVHRQAELYGVTTIISSDHCHKDKIPWLDGMIEISKEHFIAHNRPLFSQHMLDLSQSPLPENIQQSQAYLQKLAALQLFLEVEVGLTGGVEDAIDNSRAEKEHLFTKPEDVDAMFSALKSISSNFLIAAAFGNVHGAYAPGAVKLKPSILKDCQDFVKQKHSLGDKPINLVFHGGSGSLPEEIKEAVQYGIVKMNVDTDLQWAFWRGVKDYYHAKADYLHSEIGNPEGEKLPNKEYFDPRKWLRSAEQALIMDLMTYYKNLNSIGIATDPALS